MRNNCTPEQLAWLSENRGMRRKALHEAFVAKFGDVVSCDSLRRVCQRRGWLTNRKRAPTEVGHERVGADGYVRVKVAPGQSPYAGQYVLKHKLRWEAAHGPVPTNMRLKCLGDRANTDPSNWTLVPAGIMRRFDRFGKFDELPDELKTTVLAVAQITHKLEARARRPAEAQMEQAA